MPVAGYVREVCRVGQGRAGQGGTGQTVRGAGRIRRIAVCNAARARGGRTEGLLGVGQGRACQESGGVHSVRGKTERAVRCRQGGAERSGECARRGYDVPVSCSAPFSCVARPRTDAVMRCSVLNSCVVMPRTVRVPASHGYECPCSHALQ